MNVEYRSGLKAGLIAGLVWAALIAFIEFANIQINRSQIVQQQLQQNATLSAATVNQSINFFLELNSLIALIAGVAFGAFFGVLFAVVGPRFFGRTSFMTKGVIISIFFWLLYQLTIAVIDLFSVISSLAVSLFAGYVMGYMFNRFLTPQNLGGASLGPSPASTSSSSETHP